jgi:hypothetical protein
VEDYRVKLTAKSFFSQIVQQAVFIALLVGAALGLAAGLLLIFDSERAFRISDRLNQWVSTRAAIRPLEEHRDISRPMYRMHRFVGLLICAGALYSLVVIGTPHGTAAIAKSLGALGSPRLASWLSESLRAFLLVGNFAALAFGIVFTVRPSALRGIEAWADRRISARKASKPLDRMRFTPDEFVRAHPTLVGVLIALGSVYVLLNLGFALLR